MKFDGSRPTGARLRELAPRWTLSSLALIAAAALSLGALSVAHAAVVGVSDEYTAYAGHVLEVDAANGVLSNDSGDNLTATLDSSNPPAHGALVLQSDGAFTYTHEAGFVGLDSFRYIVMGDGGLGYVWVYVDVIDGSPPADDPPVDDPPIDDELEPPDVEPYLVACEAGGHASMVALCSVAAHAPAPAMGVMKQVIMAHADGLAVLRGHGRP